jgi:hypothetical protein
MSWISVTFAANVIPPSEIDQTLLSFCSKDWQKVAKIIGDTFKAFEGRRGHLDKGIADEVDARMEILVSTGQLEAQGNIRKWRYSEVRLPGGARSTSK